ncbi:hypothetical protein [Streptomyces sp. NPDC091217]
MTEADDREQLSGETDGRQGGHHREHGGPQRPDRESNPAYDHRGG